MAFVLNKLLRELPAAEYLNVSIACLRKWRRLGIGPKWIRVGGPEGRAIRYRPEDLDAYIAANTVEATKIGGNR